MNRFIYRRLLSYFPVLFGVTLFTFVLMRTIPGGPFDFNGDRALPPTIVANLEAKYHLDWPVWKQFLSYLVGDNILGEEGISKGVIRGDLGPSLHYRTQNVGDIIATSLPISAQLGLISLAIAIAIGIPAGTLAAVKQNSWLDYLSTFGSIFFLSVPNLVLAPVLIYVFALRLGWFPIAGWGAQEPYFLGFFPKSTQLFGDFWSFAALPAFALGTQASGAIARLTRASLLQVIREDYIRTARAKGIKERMVIVVHALKNSMIPVLTTLGPLFAGLVSGTFIIEQFFGINGLGQHFILSIGFRDYQVITGVTLVYGVILVTANLVVDIVYGWFDPRIRFNS